MLGDRDADSDPSRSESGAACLSRFIPKARLRRLPPIMGDTETKPQFSEKCAIVIFVCLYVRKGCFRAKKRAVRTETEPLDCDGGEEPEETTVSETQQGATFPEVAHIVDGVHSCL